MRKSSKNILLAFLLIFVLVQVPLIMAAKKPTAKNPIICKIGFTDPPTIKLGDEEVDGVAWAQMFAFKSAMEKYSRGRVKVELYANGRLGDNKSMIEQVLNGNIFGVCTGNAAFAPFYNRCQVLDAPYIFKDATTLNNVLDGPAGRKLFNDMAAKTGLRVLSWGNGGVGTCFVNRKKEVRVPADMKGLKMRVMDNPLAMELVKAIGAIPCPVAWMEVYSALQTGVVDGMYHEPLSIVAMSFYEVQKFLTLTRHTISIQYIVTSEKFFKSLPVDLRKVFVKAGREASIALRQAGAGIDDRALKVLTKSGMQVYEPTPAEKNVWVKTLRGPVVAWLKKNVDSELVDELLKASNKGK